MKCEIFVNNYLPAIRAIIANRLINSGLTQQETADKLYLTQGAIALYKKQARGKRIKDVEEKMEAKERIEELAKKLISKEFKEDELEKEYCEICKLIFG